MKNLKIRRHIELLQGYYKYLYLWKFLEHLIKHNDISPYVVDIPLVTWEKSHFVLRSTKIQKTLGDIFKNPDKKNIFWYVTEISSFRGIFGVMKEMMDTDERFDVFLRKTLKKQYFPFEQIVRFGRNVLAHALDSSISLKQTDFSKQKIYLFAQDKYRIIFSFKYANYITAWKWSEDYGLYIKLDFKKMKTWQKFFDLVDMHQVYLLSELCFNLTELFRAKVK